MKIIIAIAIVLFLCALTADAAEVSPTTRPALADCKLSGAYTHGRWEQRGSEDVAAFAYGATVAGKEVKLAAKRSMNQQEVWQEVAATQKKLSDSVGVQVMSGSGGSLQLAQEDKKVKESSEEY